MAKVSSKRSSSPKRKSSSPKSKKSSSLKEKRTSSPKVKKSSSPRRKKSSSPRGKGSGLLSKKSDSPSKNTDDGFSPDSMFVLGSESPTSLKKLGKPTSECVIGNKSVIEAQMFIENFLSLQRGRSDANIYSSKFHQLPTDESDREVPTDKWPALIDKRFTSWFKKRFNNPKYKPKVWKDDEDACKCLKCKQFAIVCDNFVCILKLSGDVFYLFTETEIQIAGCLGE